MNWNHPNEDRKSKESCPWKILMTKNDLIFITLAPYKLLRLVGAALLHGGLGTYTNVGKRWKRLKWICTVPWDPASNVQGNRVVTHNYSRKFHYFGHTSRHPKKYYLLQLVLHDKSRWPGRRRRGSWLAEMWKWHACSKEGLKYAATSKPIIAVMIAKLRRRKGDEYISLWYRFF